MRSLLSYTILFIFTFNVALSIRSNICRTNFGFVALDRAISNSGEEVILVSNQFFYVVSCIAEGSLCPLVDPRYNATCETQLTLQTALIEDENGEERFGHVYIPTACGCFQDNGGDPFPDVLKRIWF